MQNPTYKWPLVKYAKSAGTGWTYDFDRSKDLTFLIEAGHCLVTNGSTALESFSLTSNDGALQGILKERTIVIGQQLGEDRGTRFRVLFRTVFEAESCLQIIQKYFSEFQTTEVAHVVSSELPMNSLLNQIMARAPPNFPAPSTIPDSYPLDSAIMLCILDPGFLQLTERVEAAIRNFR